MRSGIRTIALLSMLAMLALTACRPLPRADEVQAAVAAHFSGRGYPLVALSVRDIRPLANSEKTYMGVPAYVVELNRLVLDIGGQERTFNNVRLLLKEPRSPGNRYIVSDIAGVPLP